MGDAEKIAACVKENGIEMKNIEIVNATETIEMCDEPAKAVRAKKDSSMVVGLRMLAEGKGDAFVSAGSTGALHVGASLIVRTVKGSSARRWPPSSPAKRPFCCWTAARMWNAAPPCWRPSA